MVRKDLLLIPQKVPHCFSSTRNAQKTEEVFVCSFLNSSPSKGGKPSKSLIMYYVSFFALLVLTLSTVLYRNVV